MTNVLLGNFLHLLLISSPLECLKHMQIVLCFRVRGRIPYLYKRNAYVRYKHVHRIRYLTRFSARWKIRTVQVLNFNLLRSHTADTVNNRYRIFQS
jgi:hypothetical protein